MLNETYEGGPPVVEAKRRYSPAVCTGATKTVVCGSPDLAKVSTSHVERANLTIRMGMRRFTRLTNAFSKRFENHMHAVSFYFMVYNFVKVHGSVKTTPAIAAGVTAFKVNQHLGFAALTGRYAAGSLESAQVHRATGQAWRQ